MINLTVKTLDSQNHAFSVEDEITIAEFKEKIADTVNIPADTQRLIYCGRVLQDSVQLKDYDVDGKVIHLVQRPPPSTASHSDPPEPQSQPQRRVRGLEYVGTVRLPVGGLENTLHSLPLHSLANSRLNVARRMINRAHNVLNALENPNRQQPVQSEPQEEATPVFEARVVIPNPATAFTGPEEPFPTNSSNTDEPSVPPQDVSIADDIESMIEPLTNGNNNADQVHSVSSTPEVISPLVQSTENLVAATDAETSTVSEENPTATSDEEPPANDNVNNTTRPPSTAGPRNTSRPAEFADILDSLNRLHTRFMPFMEQYNNFMREDPIVQQENARSTQAMINRVSEVCHYLGHAYHSVSDIILRVRSAPPRHLLCRPMLIQHSAVVQVDIPIQLEAQINIPSERNSSIPTTSTGTSTTSVTTLSATPSTITNSTVVPNSSSDIPMNAILGIPFMPRSGVRVEAFRVPQLEGNNLLRNNNNTSAASFRSLLNTISPSNAIAVPVRSLESRPRILPRSASINLSSSIPVTIAETPTQSIDAASAIASNVVNSLNNITVEVDSTASTTVNVADSASDPRGPNNPNLEFFMEVTPDSITIDSLETAFVEANHPSEIGAILQEGINPPTPEFIQSIMQMAGQLINRSNIPNNSSGSTVPISTPGAPPTTTAVAAPTPTAPPLDVSISPTSSASATTSVGAARTTPFQNSQARGNTQTQPTTATHTRSTPRPHVHLAQHTMHAFDPFLPCNSHHVLNRRRLHNTNNAASQQNTTQQNQPVPINSQESAVRTDGAVPVYNIVQNFVNSVRNTYSNYSSQPSTQNVSSSNTETATDAIMNSAPVQDLMSAATTWMSTITAENHTEQFPTLVGMLQQFPDDSYVPGESILTDLAMLLARSLMIRDIMEITNGNLNSLSGIRAELRTFAMCRILEGNNTALGYHRAVEKILGEMRMFIDQLALLETKDNIDIVQSVQVLFRARLPDIIALTVCRNESSTRLLLEYIQTTVQHLCALVVKASRNGADGVKTAFEGFLMRFLEGVPNELQQWSIQNTTPQLVEFLNNVSVPDSLLQPYIVQAADPVITSVATVENDTNVHEPEPMQVEETAENSTTIEEVISPALSLSDDTEPLPTVVLGSSPWHAQVPSDWVPIIVRDSQRQRKQSSQAPFSDAYLSGMPSKRRKLGDCNKPPKNISEVISESVQRAVTSAGISGVVPIETVTQAAGADENVQSAYRDLLHSSVQSELQNNEDFTPEQFPNVHSYFNNGRQ